MSIETHQKKIVPENNKDFKPSDSFIQKSSNLIKDYINHHNWRVKENSNSAYSIQGLYDHIVQYSNALYWLYEVYDKDTRETHMRGDFHIHDLGYLTAYCFTGDTKIYTLDNKDRDIKDICENYNNEDIYVISCNKEGKIEPAKVVWGGLTKKKAALIKVTLDNNQEIKCTPDHQFMLRDGTYKEAKNLTTEDSLMPLYKSVLNGYVYIMSSNFDGKFKGLHRELLDAKNGEVVHHINNIQTDNRPCNLNLMDDSKHRAMEFKKTNEKPWVKKKNSERAKKHNKSDFMKKISIREMTRKNKEPLFRACNSFKHTRKDKIQNITLDEYAEFIKNNGFIPASKFAEIKKESGYNHKILKIENLETTEDVYDITVDNDNHNFLLSAGIFVHNCVGWALEDLLLKGFGGIYGKIKSRPAKHFRAALGQIWNFFYTMQGESAGAQAFSSFDTYLAPFIAEDKLTYHEVYQAMEEFIYNMNVPTRAGFQTPFTNITMDLQCPSTLKDKYAIIGGKPSSKKYSEFQDEMDLINKAFCEIMYLGDAKQRIFTFPIPTYNITEDFNWENENLESLWRLTAKYGIPYFANYCGSDLDPSDCTSMCLVYDTNVRVKIKDESIPKTIKLGELVETTRYPDVKIHTPHGYRPIKRYITTEVNKTIRITTEHGRTLEMSEDHPHIIYTGVNQHKIVLAKNLKIGDRLSSRNVDSFKTKEFREKISKAMKGHEVTKNCREKSRERWMGLKNPIAKQSYWNNSAKNQLSKNETVVLEFLKSLDSEFTYQKVFNDEENQKSYIFDFYIEEKNLLIECEGQLDDKIYYNEKDVALKCEKEKSYEYIKKKHPHLDVVYINPDKCDAWMALVNQVDKIKKIEIINHETPIKVYDIEISEVEGQRSMHKFWANDILTHNCCRLRIDRSKLDKRGGGLFGSNPLTGSIGVVTINMPRLGYLATSKKDFYNRLDKLMDLAAESLITKRKIIEENTEHDLYPYIKLFLSDIKARTGKYWTNHFNTIGLVGMNECCLNFMNKDITHENALDFTKEVLNYMRDRMLEYQEKYESPFNLEATPAEGTSYKLAKYDSEKYKNIIVAGTQNNPYYTNSTQIGVTMMSDLFNDLSHQNELQPLYTGGTVFHMYLGENIDDPNSVKLLLKKICTNFKLPYISFTPTFSICPSCGLISGEHEFCPKCVNDEEVMP